MSNRIAGLESSIILHHTHLYHERCGPTWLRREPGSPVRCGRDDEEGALRHYAWWIQLQGTRSVISTIASPWRGEASASGNTDSNTARMRALEQLAGVFAIDVAAYAVMSDHFHLVLHVDVDRARSWEVDQVLRRWTQVFAGPEVVRQYLQDPGPLGSGPGGGSDRPRSCLRGNVS